LLVDPATRTVTEADLRTRDDRIAEVGHLRPEASDHVLDIGGLSLAPGLIDTHTHADCVAFLPDSDSNLAAANLLQGVTTQVCGNCGYSPFPAEESPAVLGYLLPALGPGTRTFRSMQVWSEESANRLPTNLAPLVGHGTLRAAAMGFEDRPPTASELATMKALLEECLAGGAFGLSSGLIYAPGLYASTDELAELAGVVARHRAPYASHIRNETDGVSDAVREAIEIGRRSGAAVHISHHKAAGKANWGRTVETLAVIDQARSAGADVTVDVYPYTAGSTALQALLPPWALEGGVDAMLARLADGGTRQRIRHDLQASEGWQNLVLATGWDGIRIAASSLHPDYEGSTLARIAAEQQRDPLDLVADLLIAERANVTIILEMMDEADVRNVLRWTHAMVGSDGILQPGRPHPRLAGSFARVLGRYCRQERLWPLPDAIARMTWLPAQRFHLLDRGRLTPGSAADLVAFDPSRIGDRATYDRPLEPPDGVTYVIVNGRLAVDNGALTGHSSGRVVRRR
jgi:dihydroorotase/N-acyl-D-amino-acid deacylase